MSAKKRKLNVQQWYYVEPESEVLRDALHSEDDDAIAMALALEMYFEAMKTDGYMTTYTITIGGGENVGIGL